jgi:dimeric dUTPase (all-alpha-NTP-PPase superfamily)
MNETVNPAWVKAGYRWERAAMLEAAELFDHIGWKWWKKQEIDREQCLLELVDIFHFTISLDIIEETADAPHYANLYRAADKRVKRGQDKEYIFERVTKFVEVCATYGDIDAGIFFEMVVALDYTLEDIVKWYIGKNVLNQFRQKHGYKQGTYAKNWATPDERAQGTEYEDNFVLAQILNKNPLITASELDTQLEAHYALVK